MFTIDYIVGKDDIEPYYEHVNHAHALKFLERARLDFLVHSGFPNEAFLKKGLFFVITKITVEYHREILVGSIKVLCEDILFDKKLVIMNQSIRNDRDKLLIRASIESKFMDGNTKRSVFPPEDFQQAMEAFRTRSKAAS